MKQMKKIRPRRKKGRLFQAAPSSNPPKISTPELGLVVAWIPIPITQGGRRMSSQKTSNKISHACAETWQYFHIDQYAPESMCTAMDSVNILLAPFLPIFTMIVAVHALVRLYEWIKKRVGKSQLNTALFWEWGVGHDTPFPSILYHTIQVLIWQRTWCGLNAFDNIGYVLILLPYLTSITPRFLPRISLAKLKVIPSDINTHMHPIIIDWLHIEEELPYSLLPNLVPPNRKFKDKLKKIYQHIVWIRLHAYKI